MLLPRCIQKSSRTPLSQHGLHHCGFLGYMPSHPSDVNSGRAGILFVLVIFCLPSMFTLHPLPLACPYGQHNRAPGPCLASGAHQQETRGREESEAEIFVPLAPCTAVHGRGFCTISLGFPVPFPHQINSSFIKLSSYYPIRACHLVPARPCLTQSSIHLCFPRTQH